MPDTDTWARRVAEWRSSGQTSTAFCRGKQFTAGGLRYWACRLSQRRQRNHAAVRVARVVRVSEFGASSQHEKSPAAAGVDALVVEVGAARVAVRPGFDRATLAAVLEVIGAGPRSTR
jgi:transposase